MSKIFEQTNKQTNK